MTSIDRWNKAQAYERSFWESQAAGIVAKSIAEINYHGWKANEMEKRLDQFIGDREGSRVLEIGSGPVGIVSYLKWGKRFAIDPLEDFYASNQTLTKYRDRQVKYLKGQAEKLPFDNEFFYLVILDNVLDHVQSAETVLREVHRVLSDKGLMYLALNVRRPWGNALHAALAKLLVDKGHPYSFTAQGIRRFINSQRFRSRAEWVNDYHQARKEDIHSDSIKSMVKGYLGLSEFVYYTVCSKQA